MTCEQIDEILDTAPVRIVAGELPREVDGHLAACDRCRKLVGFFRTRLSASEVRPDLQSALESRVRSSLEPVSPIRPRWIFAIIFFAIFTLVPVAVVLVQGSSSAMTITQSGLVALILLGAGYFLAVSLSRQMSPGSRHSIHPKVLHVCAVAAFLAAVLLLLPWNLAEGLTGAGMACTSHGLAFALPAAAGFWLVARRGAVLSPAVLGVTTGLLAGLMGAMVLHFRCPMAEASHIAVWHAGVPILGALAGYFVARLLEIRERRKLGNFSA